MTPIQATRHKTWWDARAIGSGSRGTWTAFCVVTGCGWKRQGFYDRDGPWAEADALRGAMELGSAHERKHNH